MSNVQPSCTCETCHLMTIDNTHAKHLQECGEAVTFLFIVHPFKVGRRTNNDGNTTASNTFLQVFPSTNLQRRSLAIYIDLHSRVTQSANVNSKLSYLKGHSNWLLWTGLSLLNLRCKLHVINYHNRIHSQ